MPLSATFFCVCQHCQVCAGKKNVGRLVFVFTRSMHDVGGDNEDPENPESEAADAHYVWQYFTVTNNTAAKKGGSKNALCSFCEKSKKSNTGDTRFGTVTAFIMLSRAISLEDKITI